MTEGSNFISMNDLSVTDFEYDCSPCGEYYVREAVKYCPECQEYLCTGCTGHHSRQRILRSHKLLDIDAVKQDNVVLMTTKCRYHPDRDIEMYCESHDMVYCPKCIAKYHRPCSGVSDIEDIHTSPVEQNDMQRVQGETKNTEKRLIDLKEKTQKNKKSLEEQRISILCKIEEVERSFKKHISKLKVEAVNALNQNYASVKDELESNIAIVAKLIDELRKSSIQLQKITNCNAEQQFIQMKLIPNTVKEAVELTENMEAKAVKPLSFTVNTDLQAQIMQSTSLGQFSSVHQNKEFERASRRIFNVKSMKHINVKILNDRQTCQISDVCQLQDGTVIVTDQDNLKVKRLDKNYNIKDYCDLEANPGGICCTGQNEVAVKMNNNKVQFISVGSSLSKVRNISIEGGPWWGMANYAGELWISTERGVNVYNTSGSLLNVIGKHTNKNVFKSFTQHITASGESVIVTDYSDGAVRLGRDGAVIQELRNRRLSKTRGACVSSDGTVFLSGHSSNNIVMFDKEGKCLGELIGEDAGLVYPVALLFDDNRGCLIVTCDTSDKIVICDLIDNAFVYL